MSENLNKLKKILREMFQLDQADLDFGIYRIMNQKRDEIEQFLDRDLLPQVKTAFASFEGDDLQSVRDEIDKLKKTLADAEVEAETSPKYQALQAKLSQTVDVLVLENEVFSQLTNFFRRYYQGGDFLSLRRYKAGVYAIPYEGEEVKLHWANADQYYIKSSENFRDYTFKLQSGKRAHFKLVDATTEQNNKKEQAGKERRFILCGENPLAEENGELFIRFEYKVDETGAKQTALTETAVQTVLATAGEEWKRELSALAPTEKNPRRTLLEKHLTDYTAKYSFDYFIHKDLGGFLRRELDFFIKNEVLFIDDLDADHVKASISKIKVIKEIGHKVIAFLAQLENFQKKLWLKKKFVVETGYCCTLDKVPEELYPSIIGNTAQVEEWKRLFAIQDIQGDLHTPAYSEPLSIEFLKANPFLVLDTAFFDREFTERLLASFDNLDETTDGVLVHSENFQALNILFERYQGQVKCTYIDPPYNTNATQIIYKNGYKHSSWLSLIYDRLVLAKSILNESGIIEVAIDDEEYHRLECIVRQVFGDENYIANVAIMHNPKGRDKEYFASAHEYTLVSSKNINKATTYRLKLDEEQLKQKYSKGSDEESYRELPLRRSGSGASRYDREYMYFPFIYDKTTEKISVIPEDEYKRIFVDGSFNDTFVEELKSKYESNNHIFILPIREDGSYGRWRWGYESSKSGCDNGFLFAKLGSNPTVYQIDYADSTYLPKTFWFGERYDASTKGTNLLKDILGPNPFDYPKSIFAVEDMLTIGSKTGDTILDFFGGSGTTAHAVINLSRVNERRKYILAEMGEHFDTVLKPRIQKVIYSKDWKDGKPISREGSSHLFKYIRLESYEDALNNLQLKRTQEQGSLLDQHDALREQYMLSYMLDVESAGSASLLNVSAFADPFNYRMNIARGNETRETVVDLVETFNWLLGIKVLRISQKDYRTAEFETDAEGRLQVKGRPRTCPAGEGWAFQEVEGETLSGDKVLIIWRTLTDKPEQDNVMLDAWFSKRNYNTLDFEFSRIYVNGDNNLENLKVGEERWKVALIEEEFKRLMFDVEGF